MSWVLVLNLSPINTIFHQSKNAQSCIKGLLSARDFCFQAVLKKKINNELWATLEGAFYVFMDIKNVFFEKTYIVIWNTKKLDNISVMNFIFYFFSNFVFASKQTNIQILKFECNTKGLLMQDWRFRLGIFLITIFSWVLIIDGN